MGSKSNQPPLVAIVGQTASGKSALALKLAATYGGEIVCADSRTIYKGMDIGTAKPTRKDRRLIPHHLLDVTTPDEPLNVARFKELAVSAIEDIQSRGKLPLLVGGTGLYIDAVLFDFSFRGSADLTARRTLDGLSVEQLQQRLQKAGVALPKNSQNPRHLVRQIESLGKQIKPGVLRPNTLLLGLSIEKDELASRINERTENMMTQGLENEVRQLVEIYGWVQPLETIGYQEFKGYFDGGVDFSELQNLIVRHTLQYAKRQKTWFKRNKRIHWISKMEKAVALITTQLNK
jgi:tRNA dimethylallyltransferase